MTSDIIKSRVALIDHLDGIGDHAGLQLAHQAFDLMDYETGHRLEEKRRLEAKIVYLSLPKGYMSESVAVSFAAGKMTVRYPQQGKTNG